MRTLRITGLFPPCEPADGTFRGRALAAGFGLASFSTFPTFLARARTSSVSCSGLVIFFLTLPPYTSASSSGGRTPGAGSAGGCAFALAFGLGRAGALESRFLGRPLTSGASGSGGIMAGITPSGGDKGTLEGGPFVI